eukprot:UN02799
MLRVLFHYTRSDEYVVASYAAYCISTLVGSVGVVAVNVTANIATTLIESLLQSLQTHPENQYMLGCIITTIGAASETILSIAPTLTQEIFKLLEKSMVTQTNQRYIYLLFELLALVMRVVIGNTQPTAKEATLNQLEALLFPPFQAILGNTELQECHTHGFNYYGNVFRRTCYSYPWFLSYII